MSSVVDGHGRGAHRLPVVSKTISIDSEAYEKLSRARLNPDESFSHVIKRAAWSSATRTGADLLAALPNVSVPSEATLEYLETRQREDAPPDFAWR